MSMKAEPQSRYVRHAQGDAALLVNRDWCKGCNLCIETCPKGILALDAGERVVVTDIGQCIFCGICAVRCPDFCFVLEHGAGRRAMEGSA